MLVGSHRLDRVVVISKKDRNKGDELPSYTGLIEFALFRGG